MTKVERNREYRLKRLEEGRCVWGGCPNFHEKDRTLCSEHLQHLRTYARKRQTNFVEAGLCRTCGKRPAVGTVQCLVCRGTANGALPRAQRKLINVARTRDIEARNRAWLEHRKADALGILFGLPPMSEREYQMIIAYWGLESDTPETLQSIATKHGMTRERVRQIVQPFKEVADGLGLPVAGQFKGWLYKEHGHGVETE